MGFLLLAALAAAQDEGGRDPGTGAPVVVFVRSQRNAESGAIYDAAWKALEPHFGALARRRLLDSDGDPKRAEEHRLANADAGLVVAFDAPSGEGWGGVPVLLVEPPRVDRGRLANRLRSFRPGASRVAVFGAAEELPGLETRTCAAAADAKGCHLAWVPEGSPADARALRRELDALGIPLVTTSGAVEDGIAALSVRPDPASVGVDLAAAVLARVRDGAPPRPLSVRRLRVAVDLSAARAAGHEVPLEALARADVVRRAP
jgi:hypothetical protein